MNARSSRFFPSPLLALRPLRTALVVVGALLAAGALTRPIEAPAWREVRSRQPELRLDSIKDGLGQGVTIGLLGGFRAIVADFFWIATYGHWEEQDLPATQTSVRLVTAIDPRPLLFWLNGSRMIAYDMPHWRIAAAGGYDLVPAEEQRRFDAEQAAVGVAYLKTGLEFHREEPLLTLEIANIYLNRLKDLATASRYYLEASRQRGAPHYAPRIYAELLRRQGRHAEAYAFLKELYPTLPDEDITAQKPLVLERIRELENTLGIPEPERFRG